MNGIDALVIGILIILTIMTYQLRDIARLLKIIADKK